MVFICVLWKQYMNRHEGILGEAEEGINGVTGGFELPSVGTRNPIPVLSLQEQYRLLADGPSLQPPSTPQGTASH